MPANLGCSDYPEGRKHLPRLRRLRHLHTHGGCELDLSRADIAHSPAIVDVFAMLGGIETFVPDRWEVVSEVVPWMAGFDMKDAPAGNGDRQLLVRGAAFMGGIEIKRRAA